MSEGKTIRINKVLKDLNISLTTAVDELKKHKNIDVEENLNTKISEEAFQFLSNKFKSDKNKREASKEIAADKRKEREAIRLEQEKENQENPIRRFYNPQTIVTKKKSYNDTLKTSKLLLVGGASLLFGLLLFSLDNSQYKKSVKKVAI
mgnify:CR=1 FL=1